MTVAESPVPLLVSVEGLVSLLHDVLDPGYHLQQASLVKADDPGGEEVVIGLGGGGEVIVPLLSDTLHHQYLDPGIVYQPFPKLPYH